MIRNNNIKNNNIKNIKFKNVITRKKQEGFVLITGLVILLIMTLVVLYNMGSSISQEKSSGALQDKNIAFQNAESALRYAENYLYSNNPESSMFNTNCTNGLCIPATNTVQVWDSINWVTETAKVIQLPAGTIANTPMQPKFMIELLGAIPASEGESSKINSTNSGGVAYRITTYAVGNRVATVAQLQSVFIRK